MKQQVLNYLQRYGSINRQTALTHCRCWNLSTVIFNLRKAGHTIHKDGRQHGVKYVLYNEANKPVFSRFIKSTTEV